MPHSVSSFSSLHFGSCKFNDLFFSYQCCADLSIYTAAGDGTGVKKRRISLWGEIVSHLISMSVKSTHSLEAEAELF